MINYLLPDKKSYFLDINSRITASERKIFLYLLEEFKLTKKNPVILNTEKLFSIIDLENDLLTKFLEKLSKKKFQYCIGELTGFSSLFSSVILFRSEIHFYLCHELSSSFDPSTKFYLYDFKSVFLFEEKCTSSLFLELLSIKRNTNDDIIISMEELKAVLKLDKSYDRFYDFERYVLKKLQKDIITYSRFNFTYEKIKDKSKIISLKIFFDDLRNMEDDTEMNALFHLIRDHTENFQKTLELIKENLKKKNFETVRKEIIFAKENYNKDFDSFLENIFNGKIDIYSDANIINYFEKSYSNFYIFQSDIIMELKNHNINKSLLEYLNLSYELYSFFYGKSLSYNKILNDVIIKILKIDSLFMVKFIYKT